MSHYVTVVICYGYSDEKTKWYIRI